MSWVKLERKRVLMHYGINTCIYINGDIKGSTLPAKICLAITWCERELRWKSSSSKKQSSICTCGGFEDGVCRSIYFFITNERKHKIRTLLASQRFLDYCERFSLFLPAAQSLWCFLHIKFKINVVSGAELKTKLINGLKTKHWVIH